MLLPWIIVYMICIFLNTVPPILSKEQFSKNNFIGLSSQIFLLRRQNSSVLGSKFTLFEQVHFRVEDSALEQIILGFPKRILGESQSEFTSDDFTLRIKNVKNNIFNVVDILKITNLTSCTLIKFCKERKEDDSLSNH